MTVIVGIVDKNTGDVIMGGDSAGVTHDHDMIVVSSPVKVFRNGDFVFGFAGDFRWGQLLRYVTLPKCPKKADLDRYMAVDFAQALREGARELGYLGSGEGGRDFGGWCLVGFRGRLWVVQETFDAVEAADGLMSIGIGRPYALGAMRALASSNASPTEVAEGALRIAEYYCSGVRGPFTLVTLPAGDNVRTKARAAAKRDLQRYRRAERKASTKRRRAA